MSEAQWKRQTCGDSATLRLGFVTLLVKRDIFYPKGSPPPESERYICYVGEKELPKRKLSLESGKEYVMRVADVFLGQALRRLREMGDEGEADDET